MRFIKLLIVCLVALLCMCYLCVMVVAHSGRTDGSGGHYDKSNGDYHYHHGYSAHEHYDMDGDGSADCPYSFDNRTEDKGNEYDDEDEKNVTFWDVPKAMLTELLPAIAIGLFSSYFLSWILQLVLGNEKGCSIAIISFMIISICSYIWLICARIL